MQGSLVVLRLALSSALLTTAFAQGSEYTTIDCPGAIYTYAVSINATNQVTGYCGGDVGFASTFLRDPDGSLRTISLGQGTLATDINDAGVITGYYDTGDVQHGFTFDGRTSVSFDVPGFELPVPVGINASGVIAGDAQTTGYQFIGFVRDAEGNITTFTVAGAYDTEPTGINASGVITGVAGGATRASGFIRDALGNITVFKIPGALVTVPTAINASGQIAGYWSDADGGTHGFTRDASGTISSFNVPGVKAPYGTFPSSINDSGVVVGVSQNSLEGFFFTQEGTSAPVEFNDPNGQAGALVVKINAAGRIASTYMDAANKAHGFVRDVLPTKN